MIRHESRPHNANRLVIVLLTAVLAAACSPSSDSGGDAACGVQVDTSSWETFRDIQQRRSAGEAVPADEIQALASSPAVISWRASLIPIPLPEVKFADWLELHWNPDDSPLRRRKRSADREKFLDNARYAAAHVPEIDGLVARFRESGACRFDSLVTYWFREEQLPADGVRVSFLAAFPEIRYWEGELLVDVSVLAAGGLDQTTDQMASLLYRNHGFAIGENPNELAGSASIHRAFEVVRDQGMASWLAGDLDVRFRSDHARLGPVEFNPQKLFDGARKLLSEAEYQFSVWFEDPQAMEREGNNFSSHLTVRNGFMTLGVAMVTVIESHLGPEALRRSLASPADFVAAYQQAAVSNPDPVPSPFGVNVPLHQTMPPLAPDVYENLIALLEKPVEPEGAN